MELKRLFEPLNINRVTIPNRIVMPAMALFFTGDYSLNDRFKAFYKERARGGAGLMIVGPMAVDEVGSNPFMIGLFEDRHTANIGRLVRDVHEETETKVGVQLMHLGRYASSKITGMTPIAPSSLASPISREVPREMTREEINAVQDAFVRAATRAKEAGVDYVEIMAAGGYLLGEFLSPATNRRTDEYGGSRQKRMRFALEVLEKVRAAIGRDLALGIRVSGHDFVPGGNKTTESVIFCREAERVGIDCISVTGGWHETGIPQITSDVPAGAYVYLARTIKKRVRVPVFASNRLGDPYLAEHVLRSGSADAVCWGRPLIADPDLPRKVKEGRMVESVPCISCNQGCLDSIFANQPVWCALNPSVGREAETKTGVAQTKKRVYVAGGGPAGLEYAVTAGRRGHIVSLYEKERRLGGQVNLVAAVPGKKGFLGIIDSLENRARAAGVSLNTATTLTAEMLRKDRPDFLVVATGARQKEAHISGIDRPNVVAAWDILNDNVSRIGRDVVIVGGGAIGCETALFLAHSGMPDALTIAFLAFHEAHGTDTLRKLMYDPGRNITVLDVAKRAAANLGVSTRWNVLNRLRLLGVEMKMGIKILAIEEDAVSIENSAGIERIPADMVVVATGSQPVNDLARVAKGLGIRAVTIGDAKHPRKIGDAIKEGFDAALRI